MAKSPTPLEPPLPNLQNRDFELIEPVRDGFIRNRSRLWALGWIVRKSYMRTFSAGWPRETCPKGPPPRGL